MSQTTVTLLGFFAAQTRSEAKCLPRFFSPLQKNLLKKPIFECVIGVLSWLVYGILLKDFAIIVANAITGFLASLVLMFKIKNG